jgi:hypothetical protein
MLESEGLVLQLFSDFSWRDFHKKGSLVKIYSLFYLAVFRLYEQSPLLGGVEIFWFSTPPPLF